MKKFLIVLLAFSMVFCLMACDSNEETINDEKVNEEENIIEAETPEDVTEPEVTEPEITEPEVTEPEITEPEVTEPEATEPDGSELPMLPVGDNTPAESKANWQTFLTEYEAFMDSLIAGGGDATGDLTAEMMNWSARADEIMGELALTDEGALMDFVTEYSRIMEKVSQLDIG